MVVLIREYGVIRQNEQFTSGNHHDEGSGLSGLFGVRILEISVF